MKTNDAVRILDKLFVKGSHRKRRAIEREKERLKIAEQLHDIAGMKGGK